ncbi:MAG TPA: trigger factor [Actinomycetota bacterium]
MTDPQLQTTAETLEKDRVKLRVEVPEKALEPALEASYRRWAGQMKVPGFRKGRVPRQIIDARVGADAVREEALRDALPDFYRQALAAEGLEAIAPPEIDIVTFDPGVPLVFEATVDVRPDIEVPDLGAIGVDAPPAEVSDADVDEQIDRLRDRFAELDTVTREVRRGDFALIDLKGYRNDELVEGASAPDFLYEVGSRSGPPKLDEELEGNRPGAILKFNDTIQTGPEAPTEEISFTVLLKEVKAKRLPPADDELAKTVGEFDTLDELREDLRVRLSQVKETMAEQELRGVVLQALVDASDLDPPEKLVAGEFEHRLSHLEEDLRRAGLTLDDYAGQIQSTELELRRDIRTEAAKSVKAELLLEEIARQNEVQVTDEDLGREIAFAAARAERDPKEVAEELMTSGRVSAVAADIMRKKALDYVVDHVNVTGRPVDNPKASVEANPS